MNSQEKDRFATLVDSYFNDVKCCLEGEMPACTFAMPLEYRDYSHLMPCDTDVQDKIVSLLSEVSTQLGPDAGVGSTSTLKSSLQGHEFGDVFAIRTTGDGDCLLHALSLCMWGREDLYRLLRGLLSLAFANPHLSEHLEELFVEEEKQRDIDLGFAGAREDKLLREEYANAANGAFTVGTYLEGIHISCLSHILRRPIVVLDGDDGGRLLACSDPDTPRHSSSSSPGGGMGPSGQSMAGIYLPVLHSSSKCTSRSPLVIAYTSVCSQPSQEESMYLDTDDNQYKDLPAANVPHPSFVGHFTAVVGCDSIHPSSSANQFVRTIPLVTTSLTARQGGDREVHANKSGHDICLVSMRVRFGPVCRDTGSTSSRSSRSTSTSSDDIMERANQKLDRKSVV